LSRAPEFEDAATRLASHIESSVAKSVEGEAKVAVAFSGGLDSSVVAFCAKKATTVIACTAFSEKSSDSGKVERAAAALGVELSATRLTDERIRSELARIDLPFEPTLMDKSLWCLYSVVSASAREAGAGVMLLGQLADELFGGYAKYVEVLRTGGEGAAGSMMKADFDEYEKRGRIRDVRACSKFVEPRLPFETKELVEFASTLPVSFKIRDGVRKAVLRRAAAILGVPQDQTFAPKKAAQYSSGVQKLVANSLFNVPE